MTNSLLAPFKTSRVVETVANYERADQINISEEDIKNIPSNDGTFRFYDDGEFWREIINNPDHFWDKTFQLRSRVVLSEWIARVPGLYWKKGSEILRDVTESAIEQIGNVHNVLQPIDKSQVVMGGIGTIRLPPNDAGYRLVSISTGVNTSSGIPLLIAPEVWDTLSLKEGSVINRMKVVWRKMPIGWQSNFFFGKENMPRGCFTISDIDSISYSKQILPTVFHPFTIMEYSTDSGYFFDYVFLTVTNEQRDYRSKVQEFFEHYKKRFGNDGTYILESDVSMPFLDAQYLTPADLRKNQYGESQLDILIKRIKGDTFQGKTIDNIIKAINENYTSQNIEELGKSIGLQPFKWITPDPVAKLSIKLLDYCIDNDKVDALLDLLVEANPKILKLN